MRLRYFLLGLLSGVVLSVIAGSILLLLMRTDGHGMVTPQQVEAGGNLLVRILGEDDPKVILVRGASQEPVSVPEDVVWTDLCVSGDGNYAFFVAWKVARFGYNYSSMVRLKLPDQSKPLSAYEVETVLSEDEIAGLLGVDRAWVNRLHSVSEDGERAVVNVSSTDKARSKWSSTYYAQGAFTYHFGENRLERIVP